MVIKSHNFAPFRRFDGTLLSYVRQSTRLRTNPSRTPKIHQNSDFLGRVFFRAKHSVIAKNRFAVLWQCFAMTIIYPQRARGTHRAEGATLLRVPRNDISKKIHTRYCVKTFSKFYIFFTFR